MTAPAEDPRRWLREIFQREARTGRPLTVAALVRAGIPEPLAELIVDRPAEMRGHRNGVEMSVAAYAPSVAAVLDVPDLSDRYPLSHPMAVSAATRRKNQ
jgi:hypothetical protein